MDNCSLRFAINIAHVSSAYDVTFSVRRNVQRSIACAQWSVSDPYAHSRTGTLSSLPRLLLLVVVFTGDHTATEDGFEMIFILILWTCVHWTLPANEVVNDGVFIWSYSHPYNSQYSSIIVSIPMPIIDVVSCVIYEIHLDSLVVEVMLAQ
ncbi:hypothetical protein CBL_02661 [Carabus blaptoides fortunei]